VHRRMRIGSIFVEVTEKVEKADFVISFNNNTVGLWKVVPGVRFGLIGGQRTLIGPDGQNIKAKLFAWRIDIVVEDWRKDILWGGLEELGSFIKGKIICQELMMFVPLSYSVEPDEKEMVMIEKPRCALVP